MAPRVLVIACGALARELLAITEQNGLRNVTVECLPASLHNRPSLIPDLVRARIRRARGAVGNDLPAAIADDTTWSDATSSDPMDDTRLLDDNVRVLDADTPAGDRQMADATHVEATHIDATHIDATHIDATHIDATHIDEGERFDEILVGYADCGTGGLLEKMCVEEGVEMLAGAHCYQFFATHRRFDELQDHALGSFYLTDFLARNWERLIWEGMGIAKHPELLEMYFGNYTRCVYLAQTDDPKALRCAHDCAERLGLELHIEQTGYGELEPALVEFTTRVALR